MQIFLNINLLSYAQPHPSPAKQQHILCVKQCYPNDKNSISTQSYLSLLENIMSYFRKKNNFHCLCKYFYMIT